MRKFLHILLFAFASFITSCNGLFPDDGNKEEPSEVEVTLQIDEMLLSGTKVPIFVQYTGGSNFDGIYELYFGNQKMEVTRSNSAGDSVVIPQNMKGNFNPSIKIGSDVYEISKEVWIYQWKERLAPGTAFRADLSGGTTLATKSITVENPGYTDIHHYESYLFGRGTDMIQLKFYNCLDQEVPGAIIEPRNATERFIIGRLWNPSNSQYDIEYNQHNFTARYANINQMPLVMVDKQSGNIIRLYKSGGSIYNYSLQWMGENQFCLLPESYGSEFSTQKLHRFRIEEYMCKPFNENDANDDFAHQITLEEVPYQNNLDIYRDWVASSWDNVYYNQDRMLKGGQLSSTSFCSTGSEFEYQIAFASYADGGIYYTCHHQGRINIHSLVGNNTFISNASDHFDIYQYADYTYLRARPLNPQDEVISLKMTKDEVIEIKEPATVIEPYYYSLLIDHNPMVSIYDYFEHDNAQSIYRRTVTSRGDDKKVFMNPGPGTIHMVSASRTAATISVDYSQNNEIRYKFYDIDNAGSVTEIGTLIQQQGVPYYINMCRLRD